MKKNLVSILLVLLLLLCSACVKDDSDINEEEETSSVATDSKIEDTTEINVTENNGQITLDDVMAANPSPAGDFFCSEDGNGGLVLMEYLGDDEIIVIPEEIDGKPINSIEKYVFANNPAIKAVKLSDTIKELSDYAFGTNSGLQIVVCGAGLEVIGQGAFQGCTSLYEVVLTDNLKTIRNVAFAGCTALKSVDIPDSVETIEGMAFYLMDEDFVINSASDSPAKEFAEVYGIKFEAR